MRKNAEISCISWDFSNLPDMFPFTRKPGCFECFLNDVYSAKPRKIAVLSIVSCQQNHALNVRQDVRIDNRQGGVGDSGFRECVDWLFFLDFICLEICQ